MIDIEAIRARAEAAVGLIDIQPSISMSRNSVIQLGKDAKALIAEVESLRKAYDSLDNSHHYLFTAFNKATAEVERLQSELDRVTAELDAVEPRYKLDPDSICYGCLNYKRISEVEEYRADDVIWGGACDTNVPCFAGSEWRGVERSE